MRVSDSRTWRLGAVWAVAVTACALALPSAANPQGDSDAAKKDIQAALDKSCACLTSKDLSGYAVFLAPNYRRIDYFGEATDREKSLAHLKTMIDPAQDLQATATIEGIRMKGDQATVLVRMKGKATTKSPDGKLVPVSWEQRETQVWTKTPEGWKLRDGMGLTETVLLDGKPYIPETSDEAAAARTTIQSVYNELVRAAMADNRESAGKVIPAGFVAYVEPDGDRATREEFLGRMKELMGTNNGTADFKLERAMLSGDKAIVLGTLRVETTEDVNGQPVKTTTSTWHRDVWEKAADGTWRPLELRPVLREKTVGGKIGAFIYASPGPRS